MTRAQITELATLFWSEDCLRPVQEENSWRVCDDTGLTHRLSLDGKVLCLHPSCLRTQKDFEATIGDLLAQWTTTVENELVTENVIVDGVTTPAPDVAPKRSQTYHFRCPWCGHSEEGFTSTASARMHLDDHNKRCEIRRNGLRRQDEIRKPEADVSKL